MTNDGTYQYFLLTVLILKSVALAINDKIHANHIITIQIFLQFSVIQTASGGNFHKDINNISKKNVETSLSIYATET